jgi:hypothetical protein
MSQAKAEHSLPTEAEEAELQAWCHQRRVRLVVLDGRRCWRFRCKDIVIDWYPICGWLWCRPKYVGTFRYDELRLELAEYFPLQQEPTFDSTVPTIEEQIQELAAEVPAEEWRLLNRTKLIAALDEAVSRLQHLIRDLRSTTAPIKKLDPEPTKPFVACAVSGQEDSGIIGSLDASWLLLTHILTNIRSACEQLDEDGDTVTITLKRCDMTESEYDALPESKESES